MAQPVTEICYISLKPGIELGGTSESAQVWSDTVSTIQQQDGFQRLHYGRTVESLELLICMIDWDSIDSHKKFIASPTYQDPFLIRLSKIRTSVHLHHFLPTPFPPKILSSAPIIEFATFYNIQPDFPFSCQKFIDGAGKPKGNLGWVSGETIEETAKHSDIVKEDADREEKAKGKGFVLLAGWESLEAHMEFRETERFKENVGFIRGNHGGVEMFHVGFKAA